MEGRRAGTDNKAGKLALVFPAAALGRAVPGPIPHLGSTVELAVGVGVAHEPAPMV